MDLKLSEWSLHYFPLSTDVTKAIERLDAVDMAGLLLSSDTVGTHMVPSNADIA